MYLVTEIWDNLATETQELETAGPFTAVIVK